ncbi:uncharacterized protein LOC142585420 [Dermacentor variabilis]|uniref:uncharacterized protein LOC142585420 n=1 Tax=Dermacentor variabilis TaxID=34621 RepID=UPI003F5C13BD
MWTSHIVYGFSGGVFFSLHLIRPPMYTHRHRGRSAGSGIQCFDDYPASTNHSDSVHSRRLQDVSEGNYSRPIFEGTQIISRHENKLERLLKRMKFKSLESAMSMDKPCRLVCRRSTSSPLRRRRSTPKFGSYQHIPRIRVAAEASNIGVLRGITAHGL